MTTLLQNPRGRSGASTVSGGLPQVNLLPPEVRAARGLKATQRWLAIALVVVLAVCVGAFGFAQMQKASASNELAAEQETTLRLEQEQAKYAEVPQVLGALGQTQSSIEFGLSTEVQWKPYLDAITAVLPEGVSLDSFNVTGASPLAAPPVPTDPLQAPSIGAINFAVRSVTLPDTAALLDALDGIPGFADAWVSTATLVQDDQGIYYTATASAQVQDSAYSGRGATTDGEQ